MITLLANVLGGSLAVLYIGYFAYSIGKPAMTVIVIGCLALMAVALYHESRDGKSGG